MDCLVIDGSAKRRKRSDTETDEASLDKVVQQLELAEKIFLNLDKNEILECAKVNANWRKICRDPVLWFKKCEQDGGLISTEHKKQWGKVIQKMIESQLNEELTDGLIRLCSDKPEGEWRSPFFTVYLHAVSHGYAEVVKVLATLYLNPNAPDPSGYTPIHYAARNGQAEVLRILAPLTENPNEPYPDYMGKAQNVIVGEKLSFTPILLAAMNGHVATVRVLAPLSENPNALGSTGKTPMQEAESRKHWEIVKILKQYA